MIVFKVGKPGMSNGEVTFGEASESNLPLKCFVERTAEGDLDVLVDVDIVKVKDDDLIFFKYPKERGVFNGKVKKTKDGIEFVNTNPER